MSCIGDTNDDVLKPGSSFGCSSGAQGGSGLIDKNQCRRALVEPKVRSLNLLRQCTDKAFLVITLTVLACSCSSYGRDLQPHMFSACLPSDMDKYQTPTIPAPLKALSPKARKPLAALAWSAIPASSKDRRRRSC